MIVNKREEKVLAGNFFQTGRTTGCVVKIVENSKEFFYNLVRYPIGETVTVSCQQDLQQFIEIPRHELNRNVEETHQLHLASLR